MSQGKGGKKGPTSSVPATDACSRALAAAERDIFITPREAEEIAKLANIPDEYLPLMREYLSHSIRSFARSKDWITKDLTRKQKQSQLRGIEAHAIKLKQELKRPWLRFDLVQRCRVRELGGDPDSMGIERHSRDKKRIQAENIVDQLIVSHEALCEHLRQLREHYGTASVNLDEYLLTYPETAHEPLNILSEWINIIWERHLGREVEIKKSSDYTKFAIGVFRLAGLSERPWTTIRDRLKKARRVQQNRNR